ncbi:unnamed protein product [Bursaphelenchus okinawaensis]|uniref:Reverse transcriptase domain-containing protein n=1 Tax=Bursaphelenchus okinawaensis TaxID=465554 RepID=A0A811KA15_9BILA|nr:unnamed protein product [Bursaphelenchus okinawaensis]CAG9095597.1 unnamed protein product [Bursaphelenchus okinawaensis]
MFKEDKYPEDYKKSSTILIFKKGDEDRIENYRPISLMPPLYKIIAGTLAERIKKKITTTLAKEQFAYRSEVSTINPLYIVKQVVEKA